PLIAVLVGPFPGLQPAFHKGLTALGEILPAEFTELAPNHNPVPFRALLALPAFVGPAFVGGQVEVGYRSPVTGVPDLRVSSEPSDEDYLVNTASHGDALPARINR